MRGEFLIALAGLLVGLKDDAGDIEVVARAGRASLIETGRGDGGARDGRELVWVKEPVEYWLVACDQVLPGALLLPLVDAVVAVAPVWELLAYMREIAVSTLVWLSATDDMATPPATLRPTS